ncbi:hypothetical protein LKD70_12625 [Ruminococcus sp. CLA-AA-H200]|uniref:PIN domain-containing protein n=1 Tax=Ruminococcus turbiniformis TaxID=2881258 RepID=A0ABS8G0Y0_9FIRM|nr:hypothetical protein [Ruminococcus turbiniformis]MCC2255253.1 hypothetical protein [Ruminococcus turbiniformis]
MEIGQNTYKLILLDTNVLREIVRNTNLAGKGFLQKFFSGKDKYAPCFSIYNALELMPYEDIFEDFLEFFSSIPCLMTVYYDENVPLFRRNGYRKSGTMILRVRSRDTALK